MGDLSHGTPAYRRVTLALFAGALAAFASLYATQPLLPLLSDAFHISPAAASLTVSASTLSAAIAMLVTGPVTDSVGRKPVMAFALFATGTVGTLAAFAPTFGALLGLRGLLGLMVAALPAAAMAYMAEEVDPRFLGRAMGLLISGNSVGGLSGRLISGTVAGFWQWRGAVGAIGLLCLACALYFWRTLPPSRHFRPQPLNLQRLLGSLLVSLKDPGLCCLYATSFFLMGGFVTLYNYISYHLLAPPYNLDPALVSRIFLMYLVGTVSSAWMGRLSDQYGRRVVLAAGIAMQLTGILITLAAPLLLKLAGAAVFTFGFFGAHSIASAWVGQRAAANKGTAASLYMSFFYLGASAAGTAGGLVWQRYGWPGVVAFIAALLLLATTASEVLARMAPTRAGAEQKNTA